jgi:hypothetical protein
MKWTAITLRLPALGAAAGILALCASMAAACDTSQAAASACNAPNVATETKATTPVASAVQQAAPSSTTAPVACATQQTVATQPTTAPMDAGMRVYLDPESGQITSIPPADAVLPADLPVEAEMQQVRLPDGSYMLDSKNGPQDYLIMKLDANGKKVVECTQDPTKALQTPPAPQREDR